jgi:phosphate acetyltransferase
MNSFIKGLHKRASEKKATIVFPESTDLRVLKATEYLQQHSICAVNLVGSGDQIFDICSSNGISIDRSTRIYDPTNPNDERYNMIVHRLLDRRESKGMTRDKAEELCKDPLWYSAGLVALGVVDAGIAGSVYTTGDVLRSGLFMIGTSGDASVISGSFLMSWDDDTVFAYADCAVVPYPDPKTLVDIAVNTAEMFIKMTGREARVAFLSFATLDSAQHERVDLVREAVQLFHHKRPDLLADGPLQFDAAYLQDIGKRKAPNSSVAGRANVFIFPNLDAGNIAYKITERLAGAKATGPIITGFDRPFNDLSRGASVTDIVDTACVAILMQ